MIISWFVNQWVINARVFQGRARQLYRAGYKNLQQVAFAESSALVKAVEFLSHKAAKQIIASAKVTFNSNPVWQHYTALQIWCLHVTFTRLNSFFLGVGFPICGCFIYDETI